MEKKEMSFRDHAGRVVVICVVTGVVALFLRTATAMPFGTIFTLAAVVVGLALAWDVYGKDNVIWPFWKPLLCCVGKSLACVVIYVVIRAWMTPLIEFGSQYSMKLATNPSVKAYQSLYSMPNPKFLYELTFMMLVGTTVYFAVFQMKKIAWCGVVGFGVLCFLCQTFFFMYGQETADAASVPMRGESMKNAVEQHGVVGGSATQIWQTAFGPLSQTEKIVHFTPGEQMPTGIEVRKGDKIMYSNPTADFEVLGRKGWNKINSPVTHEATGSGELVIKGLNKAGFVQISINRS